MSRAVSSRSAFERAASATAAPASASARAIARPRPRLAPVTTATRPSRGFDDTLLDHQRDLDGRRISVRSERVGDSIEPIAMREKRLAADGAGAHERERFGEFVLVDHRADDGDLAADDAEERNGRRLVWQPGQHDAAARPDER